jgi:peptidyl-dipeptidase Dcp
MNKRKLIGRLLVAASVATVTVPVKAAPQSSPFAAPSTLPFQAPRFDQIHDSDFLPAFDQAMADQSAEIARIANSPAPPTFANTLVAMERSGAMLRRVQSVFGVFSQTDSNPEREAIQKTVAPRLAAHSDAIYLNPKLFARVKQVYDKRDQSGLNPEQRQLLKVVYQRFIRAGAQLSADDQTKLRAINTQLSSLQTGFSQKLLAATKAGGLVVDNPATLSGLSNAEIASAAQAAKDRGLAGKWLVPLQNTTQQPALADLADRSTRQRLFELSWTRTEKGDSNDTRSIISEIAQLRAEKAALLGYPDWASFTLADQMAETPAAALGFMDKLIPPTAAEERREAAEINRMIKAGGESFTVQPWDWERYSERVRKARYNLDQSEVKPYFELNTVLEKGLFYAASQLYGISFKERHDLPVWHDGIRVFEVFDANGKHLGIFYTDYFKRDSKRGGAWTSSFVSESKLLNTAPVVYNVANFPKPAPGQPALISFDNVNTMFHEFGHALHALFQNITYPSLGASARDFVEFPSQFNEHWALDPKVLANYALHYQTQAPMPQALVGKIRKASTFNQGYDMGELIAAAELDMRWHALAPTAPRQDVDQFESQALSSMGLDVADVPPRYRSSYFEHIWSGGYAAGYYGYLWTQMLEDDAFAWFQAHGGLTRANGDRFRKLVLSRGHMQDYGTMFRNFYGKDPDIGPMLEDKGFTAPAEPTAAPTPKPGEKG